MSVARHHAEWLSLVPVSGPFLSMPVLSHAFPQGLDKVDSEVRRSLRLAFAEWEEASERKADPAVQSGWIDYVLTQLLDLDPSLLLKGQQIPQTLQIEVPEHGEVLQPTIVLNDPHASKPRVLIRTYPRSQSLTNYVANSPWKASPDTRMTELLHATGVRLGIVTNGEHWMLVHAPKGETTGYASWYASLWLDEPITFQAFRTLLSSDRFFNVPDNQTLEALLEKSASNQQEVTDQLGYQVRRAVEVLIHSLDRADQDAGGELLSEVEPTVLYEAALTVMMRLVFLFCAEERELIPGKPFPVFEQNYSVSAISKQLREFADQLGEEILERRGDAWPRLLACFRMIYAGAFHQDIQIPAYGGKLFDPDRFVFLEGRKSGTSWREAEAKPLPVNNRTVLHLLEALQILQIKVPGGGPAEARRLSFRALDIEQIGHVYEGLLDHTAKRASEPYLGLAGTRDKEPEIPLSKLEEHLAKGEGDFIKSLKEETGRSEAALKKAFNAELEMLEAQRFRAACQTEELWIRVEPFAGLVRDDGFGYPVVITQGSVFVTAGTDRRSSGTHYTPRSLTEPIVQYTLEPLVYVGPAEGLPKAEWKLKSAKELLDLNICDMACGSGAFLVQAARYMSERLMEAWSTAEANIQSGDVKSLPAMTPFGEASTGAINEELIPLDPAERKTYAMRLVAQRCLYGVDKNPLAVEMAKLSLWLLTLAKDKPFEFLDHSIRCGDSLVGIHDVNQLKEFSLDGKSKFSFKWPGEFEEPVDAAIQLRLRLEDMPANTLEDVQRQEELLAEANEKIARLRFAADMLVAAEFWGEGAKDKLERVRQAAVKSGYYVEKGPNDEFEQVAANERRGQYMFHWPLEFPEVIVKRGGFDAFVGNPPFVGGRRIRGTLGAMYLSYLTAQNSASANADLCAYFFRRAAAVSTIGGAIGLLATNSIGDGDTRDVGLAFLNSNGFSIYRAVSSREWPGVAGITVAEVWIYNGVWHAKCRLDGRTVSSLSPFLSAGGEVSGDPHQLKENDNLSFQGSNVLGRGFFLTPEEARVLKERNTNYSDVIFPFVRGEDFNASPDQSNAMFIINFFDWPLDKANSPSNYAGPVASDYPECLEIVDHLVRPHRGKAKRKAYRDRWWQYAERCASLYVAVDGLQKVIFHASPSKHVCFAFAAGGCVYSGPHTVIASDSVAELSVLQSSVHTEWAWEYCSKMRNSGIRFNPSDYRVFPRPVNNYHLLTTTAEQFNAYRTSLMSVRNEGLTTTYNNFHDPTTSHADIQKLRELHVEMDLAVAAAYDWTDVDLGHGFHETKQGVRFTISEPARREVLQRLLKLNHERYAEEVAQGLHDKKKAKHKSFKGRSKKTLDASDSGQESLF